jgi:site-specific recombinase XerC
MRDKAMILLLARLGLRAGDIAGLGVTDIDWNAARILVSGKSRRQEYLSQELATADQLPLPVAIAKEAIVADTLEAVGKHVEQATGCQILVTVAPASNFVAYVEMSTDRSDRCHT